MNDRGFTLAEMLVACAIIGMVMAGIFTLQQQGQLAYLWGSARVEVQQNARLALDLMTRELRSAQSITTMGANCNTDTGANTITFNNSSGTSITYSLSGTSSPYILQRAGSDVIGGVDSFKIFCYGTDGYSYASSAADIRSVKIQLQTRVADTAVSGSSERAQYAVVESRVRLRNL